MEFVIMTGMSGAGKTVALKTMEDLGYYCVDNMPVLLIPKFLEILQEGSHQKAAIVVDIRNADQLSVLRSLLEAREQDDNEYRILFLDASDQTLVKRFKETRRAHPLSADGHVEDGIRKEREALGWLKKRADYVLDTSTMLTRDLRQQLEQIFSRNASFRNLYVTILSFGYKYGIPQDADMVFDVRFLPNPYYVEELRAKTGLMQEVRDFVMQNEDSVEFMQRLNGLLDFLIPRFIEEGKNQLIIAFGCTGGRHRSVTVAEAVYAHLKENADYGLKIEHSCISR
ncbi:MAG: RNase adapter RapZ [Lachnospiraceae bacterium]|nr:RNase adapter RapZ [Lachnospiraceae bacterium]